MIAGVALLISESINNAQFIIHGRKHMQTHAKQNENTRRIQDRLSSTNILTTF
jgi:hypothetical protein